MGPDDYEVALSIGHLASLYNYDLDEHSKAERLYLRSIDIGLKLFGPSYSGLEYDYRGLIKIYQETHQYDKSQEWSQRLRHWRDLRDGAAQEAEELEEKEVLAAEEAAAAAAAAAAANGVSRAAKAAAATAGGAIKNAAFYLGAGAGKDATPRPIGLILSDLDEEV